MFGAAQVLLKRFGATPVHVWCSTGHQSMQKKYQITSYYHDPICTERGFQTDPGLRNGTQKNTRSGTVHPALIRSIGFI